MRLPYTTLIMIAVPLLLPALAIPAGAVEQKYRYPFRNPDLPLDIRIEDLLDRLTLDEKVSLMHQYQPAIPRLDIPAFKTGTEALHGVAWLGEATVFPQAIGLASTWNPELVERVGSAVGDEVRGYHVKNPTQNGLNVWAPVVNLLRDPRWGRNEEGYSEDPVLTGAMSTAYAGGLRGDHTFYLKTAPNIKHFLAYNNEWKRDTTSSSLPPRVLHEYYLQAFKPAISSGFATGIMPGYNFINGRPAHLSSLINDLVREWAPKELMVVSDAYAPGNVAGVQEYYDTHAQSHAAMIKAGIDSFTDRGADSSFTLNNIHAALDQGLVSEADIDAAVRHILSIRFRLGNFDPPGRNPYADITPEVINSLEHRALAREAARQSMVLLKNENATLPLDAGAGKRIAVIGPLGNNLYEDWYSGTLPYEVTPLEGIRDKLGSSGNSVAFSEGVDKVALKSLSTGKYVTGPESANGGALAATAESVSAAQTLAVFDWGQGVYALRTEANGKYISLGEGDTLVNTAEQPHGWVVQETFNLVRQDDGTYVLRHVATGKYVTTTDDGTLKATATSSGEATRFAKEIQVSGTKDAAAAASSADVAVLVVGNNPFINGRETDDREQLRLPRGQRELIRAVREANPNTVLVVESSYPEAIDWADEHVPAILWSSHGGQEMGNALADVLFGDYAPAGRLTQTWYRSVDQLPGMLDYDIIHADRTYLYFDGKPLYPFGYGLTYTDFRYDNLRLSGSTVDADDTVTASVDVTNVGEVPSDEVVQLYTHARESAVERPVKKLRGFRRVRIEPGQTKTVTFQLPAAELAVWDVTRGRFVVEAGSYELMVGRSSSDIRQSGRVRVQGTRIRPPDLTRKTKAETFTTRRGIEVVDETKVRGRAVGVDAEADDSAGPAWIGFEDASARGRVDSFTARVANASSAGVEIEIRIGDPEHGRLAGRVSVPHTASWYDYTTVSSQVRGVHGGQSVYLVLRGEVRVDTFSFGD